MPLKQNGYSEQLLFFLKNHFAKANAAACYNVYAAEFLIVTLEMPLSYSRWSCEKTKYLTLKQNL